MRTAFHKQTTIKMFRSFCRSRSTLLHKRSVFLTKRTKVGLNVSGALYEEFDSELGNENFNELVAHEDQAIIYHRSVYLAVSLGRLKSVRKPYHSHRKRRVGSNYIRL